LRLLKSQFLPYPEKRFAAATAIIHVGQGQAGHGATVPEPAEAL